MSIGAYCHFNVVSNRKCKSIVVKHSIKAVTLMVGLLKIY